MGWISTTNTGTEDITLTAATDLTIMSSTPEIGNPNDYVRNYFLSLQAFLESDFLFRALLSIQCVLMFLEHFRISQWRLAEPFLELSIPSCMFLNTHTNALSSKFCFGVCS